jgi:hypothetical protein
MAKEIQLTFGERSFRLTDEELGKIVGEAAAEIKKDEEKKGIIGPAGMYGIADRLRISGCFACGEFEDYSGSCRYSSEIKAIEDGVEKGFCRRDDIPLKYAIKTGHLKQYEIKEAKKKEVKNGK